MSSPLFAVPDLLNESASASFVVSAEKLAQGMAFLSSCVPSRPTHPILACAHLRVSSGRLEVSATDLSAFGKSLIDLEEPSDDCEFCLPYLLLLKYAQSLKEEGIDIEFSLSGDVCNLLAGASKLSLPFSSGDSWVGQPPEDKEQVSFFVEDGRLCSSLSKVAYAASNDESKQVLCGIHLSIGESFEFAATDGHRLAMAASALSGVSHSEWEGTLPRYKGSLEGVLNCATGVTIAAGRGYVGFKNESHELLLRLIDGAYPAYKKLIPSEWDTVVSLNRKELKVAIDRATLLYEVFEGSGNWVVQLEFDENRTRICVVAQDAGSSAEEVPSLLSGDPMTVAFNGKYLLSAIKAISSECLSISLNSPKSPVVLSPVEAGGDIHLLMPIEIK